MSSENREVIKQFCAKWATPLALADISNMDDDAALALASAIKTAQDDLHRARKACDAWRTTAEARAKKITRLLAPQK